MERSPGPDPLVGWPLLVLVPNSLAPWDAVLSCGDAGGDGVIFGDDISRSVLRSTILDSRSSLSVNLEASPVFLNPSFRGY